MAEELRNGKPEGQTAMHPRRPPLTVRKILAWADAYRKRHGKWPTCRSGPIIASPGDTWNTIDSALRSNARGLNAERSVCRLLVKYRDKKPPPVSRRLSIKQVLAWADAHHKRTGEWPKINSGVIPGSSGDTWNRVGYALHDGCRGLPKGISLARLLQRRRGVRNVHGLSRLTLKQVLKWIDAHKKRTGRWPTCLCGAIPRSAGESWQTVQAALWVGSRGFPGRQTLPQILDQYRGVRDNKNLPALRIPQVLKWADAHHKRTGRWPKKRTGKIPGAPNEKWSAIDSALVEGLRGLRGGSSLPRLLARRRGVRNIHDLPRLTVKQILAWADACRKRNGKWPQRGTGNIPHTGGETWESVNRALNKGTRGLRPGRSLAKLLNQYRRKERGL